MIFTTYLDASGVDTGSQDVVLAGYVATCDQWAAFETEWQSALTEFGLDFFHMTDFASKVSPYNVWTYKQREDRFTRLATIINAHVICSVAVILPKLEYAAAMGEIASRAMPGRAYGFAATYLTAGLPFAMNRDYSDPWLAYVLDKGTIRGNEIIAAMNRVTRDSQIREKMRFLSVRSEDKRRFVPLQAADILAWQWYHYARTLNTSIHKNIPFSRHLIMVKAKSGYLKRLNESDVRVLTARIRNFILPQLLASRKIGGLEET